MSPATDDPADLRRAALKEARRVVVKIGSRLIADDPPAMTRLLADEVFALRQKGLEVIVVSSGAIALGMLRLGWAQRPQELPRLQAAAAVGQGQLMKLYDQALSAHGLTCAQVLLTHDDVRHRGRYLAARHALLAMLQAGAVPIINENDTVSADEIKFGDNDRLAALTTSLVEADLLVILTDVNGLYDGDPRDPAAGARLLPLVRDIDREAVPVAGGAGSAVGTGGMASKVQAARIAGRFGVPTVVTSGRLPRPLCAAIIPTPEPGPRDDRGTLFLPSQTRLQSRKHWIAYALKPTGSLVVDQGARRALCQDGKSLLPSGIRQVFGDFGAGDPVSVCEETDKTPREFARGLCGYEAAAVRAIAGKRSSEIEAILGYKEMDEVIHRDDLVLL
jgi:glutamate 5-kinase